MATVLDLVCIQPLPLLENISRIREGVLRAANGVTTVTDEIHEKFLKTV